MTFKISFYISFEYRISLFFFIKLKIKYKKGKRVSDHNRENITLNLISYCKMP